MMRIANTGRRRWLPLAATVRACGLAISASLMLVANTGPAMAADSDGKFAVKGAARTTCERFVRSRDDEKERKALYPLYTAWIDGYLSSVNERTTGMYDITSFESAELLSTLVYNNCKKNPTVPFFHVVRRLVSALEPTRLTNFSKLVPVEGVVENQDGTKRNVKLHLYEETLRRLQNSLRAAGLYEGAVDGTFNAETKAAVLAYQKTHKLPITGLPDQFALLRLFRPQPDQSAQSKKN